MGPKLGLITDNIKCHKQWWLNIEMINSTPFSLLSHLKHINIFFPLVVTSSVFFHLKPFLLGA